MQQDATMGVGIVCEMYLRRRGEQFGLLYAVIQQDIIIGCS